VDEYNIDALGVANNSDAGVTASDLKKNSKQFYKTRIDK
jgi:hypothetical protein